MHEWVIRRKERNMDIREWWKENRHPTLTFLRSRDSQYDFPIPRAPPRTTATVPSSFILYTRRPLQLRSWPIDDVIICPRVSEVILVYVRGRKEATNVHFVVDPVLHGPSQQGRCQAQLQVAGGLLTFTLRSMDLGLGNIACPIQPVNFGIVSHMELRESTLSSSRWDSGSSINASHFTK